MPDGGDNGGPVGVVYLLHFDQPYQHAQHYIGFCSSYHGLDSRLEYHAAGRGSRLLAAVAAAGIPWRLARIWHGTRTDERRIKNRHCSPQYCACCKSRPLAPTGLEEIPL